MATHASVLAWRIPGTGEPGGLPSMGSHRVGHDWSDLATAAADFLLGYTDCAVQVWSPCLVKDRGKGQKCEGKSTSLSPRPEGDADSGASVFGGRPEKTHFTQTHRDVGCISSGTLVPSLVPQLLLFCLQFILKSGLWWDPGDWISVRKCEAASQCCH